MPGTGLSTLLNNLCNLYDGIMIFLSLKLRKQAEQDYITCPCSHTSKWWRQNSHSGTEMTLLTTALCNTLIFHTVTLLLITTDEYYLGFEHIKQ